jgi:hypothetical protein
MASAVVSALSMAVGKAAGNGSVDDLTQAKALVSALGARIWFTVKPWGLLILLVNLYLCWVYLTRYSRVNAIKKKYGYTSDPASYKDMTIEIAQEIEKNLAEWDMPWLFELGWLFNFLAVSGSPFPISPALSSLLLSLHTCECCATLAAVHLLYLFASARASLFSRPPFSILLRGLYNGPKCLPPIAKPPMLVELYTLIHPSLLETAPMQGQCYSVYVVRVALNALN